MSCLFIEVEIFFPSSQSLKDKRAILRSIKDKLVRGKKVSVAEVEYQNLWQRSLLELAFVQPDSERLKKKLNDIRSYIEGIDDIEVIDFRETYI